MMEILITFQSDKKGYFDRECPNENCLYSFKINIDKSCYVSRAADSATMALTTEQHAATKSVFRDWLYDMTGKKVGGKVDWSSIPAQEMQNLTERMFDATNVPSYARENYYREFTNYIYGLGD